MLSRVFGDKESLQAFQFLDFRRFIFSKFMLTLALQMQFVVLSWQVYEITKDPFSLGLLGLAEAIPAVGLALYGGYIADRKDRKKILALAQFFLLLCSLSLLGVTYYYSELEDSMKSAMPFYGIMFLIGFLRGFYSPAQLPFMTMLIPRSAYANSSAWNSTFWHIAVVVGSTAGGLLLGAFGKISTYTIVVLLTLFAFLQIIRIPRRPMPPVDEKESMRESISKGWKFVFGNQAIFGALLLDLVAVLFGGAIAMLPVFASDILMVGEEGFGLLRAAPFAGSVIMALYMTKHPPLKNSGRKLMFCVAGFGACMIVFALSENFYLSLFMLALSGAFDNVSVVIRATIIQLLTPDEMRGRVSAVSTMFISSSNEIGAFESGFAAKLMGLVPSVVFGGAVAIASAGGASFFLPGLRRLSLNKVEY
ncbi:MAG: MFS transporter [Bacteroidetes bacterium]|nr:MAG: MFS transporter [Bacteroidota bacterium]REK07066.1 MAG: MFS transporter [Bacteroidota bacterium]REK33588.1 MAG: MFS transporter [Bacteroidota bacterium]REK48572.1 MAG: MFS transporter [Bacteroidota bacterium]